MNVPRLRAPIVLAHGLFGFARLGMGKLAIDYFPGIAPALTAGGNRVLLAQVSPTGSIASRALQLKEFIDRESPGEPVHIFGHSMGGLDARFLISCLDMAPRVLSLTTIGTPHRGSPFADWSVKRFRPLYRPVFEFLGLSHDAFADLTIVRCQAFNAEVPDAAGVRYFSVAGKLARQGFDWQWELPTRIVAAVEGDNDGVVSLTSARYGEDFMIWDADHLNLTNWPSAGGAADRLLDYVQLVKRLKDEGF